LKRILTNLVSNAVQAMPTIGKLTITAFRQNDKAVINVEDNGAGYLKSLKTRCSSRFSLQKLKVKASA
jgi:C4-dicarboxylate-specific signal transduction histidine kinase